MSCFRPVLIVINSYLASEQAIKNFMAKSTYLRKILMIAEDLDDPLSVHECIKIFKVVLSNETSMDQTMTRFPNTLNFLIKALERFRDNDGICIDVLLGLKTTLQKQIYITNINKDEMQPLGDLKKRRSLNPTIHAYRQEVAGLIAAYPAYKVALQHMGL